MKMNTHNKFPNANNIRWKRWIFLGIFGWVTTKNKTTAEEGKVAIYQSVNETTSPQLI